MKTNLRRGKSAFTLIELMAVITIIVILAALVVGGLGFVTERQAKEKARAQLALLGKALEDYHRDMGYYPRTANASTPAAGSSKILYQALFYEGYSYTSQSTPPASWANKATVIYLPLLDPTSTKQGWVDVVTTGTPPATSAIKDPWGNEYLYRSSENLTGTSQNSNTMNPDYDLWSAGKDGLTDGTKVDPKPDANKKIRDDIRNF